MSLMIPTIHLNGTSKGELRKQLETAAHALTQAADALGCSAPNGRDYYPQGDNAFNEAVREHSVRVEKIRSVHKEIMAIWEGIEGQG